MGQTDRHTETNGPLDGESNYLPMGHKNSNFIRKIL